MALQFWFSMEFADNPEQNYTVVMTQARLLAGFKHPDSPIRAFGRTAKNNDRLVLTLTDRLMTISVTAIEAGADDGGIM